MILVSTLFQISFPVFFLANKDIDRVVGYVCQPPHSLIHSKMFVLCLLYSRHCFRYLGNSCEPQSSGFMKFIIYRRRQSISKLMKSVCIIELHIVICSMKKKKRKSQELEGDWGRYLISPIMFHTPVGGLSYSQLHRLKT